MGTEMFLEQIYELPRSFEKALVTEDNAMRKLRDAESAFEFEKARVIIEGRAQGLVNGKNADERSEQIQILLDGSNSVYWLSQYVREDEEYLSIVTAERKALEMRAGLFKAWLYSQSAVK